MTKLASIIGGTIAYFPAVDPAILATHPEMTLEDCFPAEFLAACASVSDAAEVGWTWDGKVATAPVIAPPAPLVRTVPGAALVHVLDKTTKVCARDLAYVAGLNTARENMASILRIATVDGSTPKAWFDAALGV